MLNNLNINSSIYYIQMEIEGQLVLFVYVLSTILHFVCLTYYCRIPTRQQILLSSVPTLQPQWLSAIQRSKVTDRRVFSPSQIHLFYYLLARTPIIKNKIIRKLTRSLQLIPNMFNGILIRTLAWPLKNSYLGVF